MTYCESATKEHVFIQGNEFKNVVCRTVAILFRPPCFSYWWLTALRLVSFCKSRIFGFNFVMASGNGSAGTSFSSNDENWVKWGRRWRAGMQVCFIIHFYCSTTSHKKIEDFYFIVNLTKLLVCGKRLHIQEHSRMCAIFRHISGKQYDCFWKVNSLAPGRGVNYFKSIIFNIIIQNWIWGNCCEIALGWKPQNFTNEKSILVQVMAWCRQATSLTWASIEPDLCHHMASPDHNELTERTHFPLWGEYCQFLWHQYFAMITSVTA